MSEQVADDKGITRSAGKQLLIFAAIAILGLAALMFVLDALASLVGSDSGTTSAVEPELNMVTLAFEDEPPTLDSTQRADAISGRVITHIMQGLLDYDQYSNIVPGVAERWEIKPEEATFWLRKDARWSDGQPVTAHDFVFAWRKAADPHNASEYAFMMHYVKNGEAVANGELPLDALGVTAVNDTTLHVDLERPTAFFDKLMAFQTFFPIREDFYQSTNGRYAADPDQLLSNGPFKLTRWVHGASLTLEKNEHFWNADSIQLDAINVAYISRDPHARFNFFKDDKVALSDLGAEQLNSAMENNFKIKRFQDGSLFYLEFNHRDGYVTRNWHLRRAMQLVTDSGELVNRVIKLPGFLPGRSFFPTYLKGVEDSFRREHPAPEFELNVAKALEHLEKAKRELGVEEIPPITMLIGDSPLSKSQAEYFQSVYKETLGLDVKIDAQIFKQRLEKMTHGDFDVVMAGWGPDYDDLLTFGDMFASWNLNNHGRWINEEYNRLVALTQNSIDQKERVEAFARMQQILHDEVVLLPHYERGRSYVVHPHLKGIVRRVVGADLDLRFARIDPDAG